MNNFINPSAILKRLRLTDTIRVADFGCGSGGWVIPLAKIANKAKIYAIDILEEPLSVLQSKFKDQGITNVQIIKANVENKLPISDNSIDLVLMTNLLFQSNNRDKIFKEARRILRQDGQVLVVDWKKNTSLSPENGAITGKEVEKLAKENGFEKEKEFEAGNYHYGLIFKKV